MHVNDPNRNESRLSSPHVYILEHSTAIPDGPRDLHTSTLLGTPELLAPNITRRFSSRDTLTHTYANATMYDLIFYYSLFSIVHIPAVVFLIFTSLSNEEEPEAARTGPAPMMSSFLVPFEVHLTSFTFRAQASSAQAQLVSSTLPKKITVVGSFAETRIPSRNPKTSSPRRYRVYLN